MSNSLARMSFFHVLPSNVAPDTFPRNHASAFSTPVSNPYNLKGKWEVALMNITHSGCVNTFHNDQLFVEKPFTLQEHLERVKKPIRVQLTTSTVIQDIVQDINEKLKNIVKVTLGTQKSYAQWKLLNPNICIILSPHLRERFDVTNDVITSWDKFNTNYFPLKNIDWTDSDYNIILVPLNYNKKRVHIKSPNENISIETFIARLNEKLKDILHISLDESHFILEKLKDDNFLTLCSPMLHNMLNFRQAGMFAVDKTRFYRHYFSGHFKSEFYVDILHVDLIPEITDKLQVPITLPPRTFKRLKDVVPYLNEKVQDYNITFSLNETNTVRAWYAQVSIGDKETSIIFSNTLRDIFAFDKNRYSGIGTFRASDTFSLTRRIHYLYVYSNVSDYVRIGNTKAPLLAVIPFTAEVCQDLLIEKTFKMPMYVPVIKEHISQIDIFIYDGAGELVPFSMDAVTSLRLHFRQV